MSDLKLNQNTCGITPIADVQNNKPYTLYGILMVVLGACIVGTGPIMIKWAEITNPYQVIYYRMSWGYFAFLGYFLFTRQKATIAKPINLRLFIASFFLAANLSLYYLSMHYTAIPNASLVGNLSSVFVILISWIFLKQRPSRNMLFGLMTAILGLVVLVGFDPYRQSFLGDIMALTASGFYALYFMILSKATKEIGPIKTNFYITLYCSAFCLVFMVLDYFIENPAKLFAVSGPMEIIWNVKDLFFPSALKTTTLMINAFLGQVIGVTLIMYGLRYLSPSMGSMASLSEPITTIALSALILSEQLYSTQIFGSILIMLAIWLSSRS